MNFLLSITHIAPLPIKSQPAPLSASLPPDRRFEVNTANTVLFDNLSLAGLAELIPGRLFTTRMPRNLTRDPGSARRFAAAARDHALHTVLILTETHEYDRYAGADLEAFYASLGLEAIHRPIPDY